MRQILRILPTLTRPYLGQAMIRSKTFMDSIHSGGSRSRSWTCVRPAFRSRFIWARLVRIWLAFPSASIRWANLAELSLLSNCCVSGNIELFGLTVAVDQGPVLTDFRQGLVDGHARHELFATHVDVFVRDLRRVVDALPAQHGSVLVSEALGAENDHVAFVAGI